MHPAFPTEQPVPEWLIGLLRCPESGQTLKAGAEGLLRSDGKIYRVEDGILQAVHPPVLTGRNERYHRFYERIAPYYARAERILAKLITGIDVDHARREVIDQLNIPKGIRVIEVSPVPGVFTVHLLNAIGDEGELVAVDLSQNMLHMCRAALARPIALIRANAEYLPFAANAFDLLFHFGGINLFSDPSRAIREFARVVKSGGRVIWGDEGFTNDRPPTMSRRLLKILNPGYRAPRPQPPETLVIESESAIFDGNAYLVIGRKR